MTSQKLDSLISKVFGGPPTVHELLDARCVILDALAGYNPHSELGVLCIGGVVADGPYWEGMLKRIEADLERQMQ
jgi:hypothetical protein